MPPEYIDIAYALGIGVLVGLERQHREMSLEPEPAEESSIGVRTFALLALLGWLTHYLSDELPWIPVGVIALVGVLLVSQHWIHRRHEGAGITTEIAALLTLALGMLVAEDRLLASTLGILATLLLISKPWVGSIVSKLRRVELTGTLQLLIAVAIVIPLLPAEPADPWDALPPRAIGLFIVLIAGLSYIGYFLSRMLGKERGVGVTGAVGGLASSTAVTATMAQTAAKDRAMRQSAQLAVYVANAMLFVRVLVIAAVVSPDTALRVAPPMAAMGAVMAGASLWRLPALRARADGAAAGPELRNPFSLLPALKWGAVLSAVLLVSTIAADHFGSEGVVVVAAISGLVDVDPIVIAASRQAAAGDVTGGAAALAITAAVISNFIVKGGIALSGGGRSFGTQIVLLFGLASAVGIAVALATATS